LAWINTICNPPIANWDALKDCLFLKEIFMSFVPATLTTELQDMLRQVSAKQTQDLNAAVLSSALSSYAESTNLLVIPPITKNVTWDPDDVIRDLTFNILICGLQSKKRKSLLTKILTEMNGPSQEKLRTILTPYRGDKLLDPSIDLRGIIILAQNQPDSTGPGQGGSGKYNSWSPAQGQKADSGAYGSLDAIGRKSKSKRPSVKSVSWGMLPPPSNPDPLNPQGFDSDDPVITGRPAESGVLSNEVITDTGSQLQTVSKPPAKSTITFSDPQHAMAEVARTAQTLNQQPNSVNPQTNELLEAVKSELTKKIIEEQSKALRTQTPNQAQFNDQINNLQQQLKEVQVKQTDLRSKLQTSGISVPSQSGATGSSVQLADQTSSLIDELYLLVQKAPPPGASTDANQSELSKQIIGLVFEFLKVANTGSTFGIQAGDALAKATSFGLGIMVTLMLVVMALSFVADMDLHDHTMLRPT